MASRQSPPAPVITEHPRDFSGDVGANFELSANASGVPTTMIEWQKKDTATGAFVNIGKVGGKLTFASAKSEDSGVYRARAYNVAGEAFTAEATVKLAEIKYSFVTQVVAGNAGYWHGGTSNVNPSKATCPAGWALVGGGYAFTGNYSCSFDRQFVRESRPDSETTKSWNTWLAALECSSFYAYAICARLQPLGAGQPIAPEVKVEDGSSPLGPTSAGVWSSTSTCPSGYFLSGGGHRYVSSEVSNYSIWRMILASQPTSNSSSTWETHSIDFTQKATALCVKLPPEVKAQNLARKVVTGETVGNQGKSIAQCPNGYSLTGAGHDTSSNDGCAEDLQFSKLTYPRTDNHSVEVVKDCAKFSAKAICLAVVDK